MRIRNCEMDGLLPDVRQLEHSCRSFRRTRKRSTHSAGGTSSRAVTLGSVSENDTVRVTTGIGEFDRVLGGGVVVGSTVLIGGDPGIGKSTLIMQAAGNLKKTGGVIYVSGEESKAQLKLRAVRCGSIRNCS